MDYDFSTLISSINSVLFVKIFDNELYKIMLAIIVFFVVFFGLKFAMKHLHHMIKSYIKDKKGQESIGVLLLKLIKDLPRWFFLILELYIPIKVLSLPSEVDFVVNVIFFFVVTLQVIKFVSAVLVFSFSGLFKKKNVKENKTAKKTIQMIVNIVVWVIGILIFLTNIGVDLTPIVASLGVASIAIAFALQNILSDLFSSFSIIMSKPFMVGDYIVVGEGSKEKSGTVKDITLKATHLLSVGGQEVVIPNSNILATEIINYGKMNHRRKRFKIGVVYDTPLPKLKKIPDLLKNIIEKQEFTTYERSYLYELSAYSIDFFVSYDVEQPDYLLSLDIQEKIMMGILESFKKEGIHFAYPTQTLHTPDLMGMHKK